MLRTARACACALVLAVSGCALTFDATHLGVPASLASAAQAPDSGEAFQVTRHPVFLLWGAFAAGSPSIEDVLAGQLGTGARVANLRIRVHSSLSDLFFTALTLGLVVPRSVTFEGTVVQK